MQVLCTQFLIPLFELMRLFAFILSLYILALSLVPCSDNVAHFNDHIAVGQSTDHHDHDHSDHSNDTCTPFCSCACCGTIFTMPASQFINPSKLSIPTDYFFHYSFTYSFDFNEGIWEPPALS